MTKKSVLFQAFEMLYLQWVIVLPFTTSLGMVPVKELSLKSRKLKPGNVKISSGIVPFNLFLAKDTIRKKNN